MAQFTGTLRIEGDRGAPLPVRAEIADDRLVLTTEGRDLGSWPLHELQPRARGAGVGMLLDGDPVVIDVGNADRFYDAVAQTAPTTKKRGRGKKAHVAPSAYAKEPAPDAAAPKRNLPLPSARVTTAVVLLLAVVLAAVLAPTVVGAVALFLGLVLVIIASGAVVDTRVALRLPFGLDALHVMVGGVGVLVVGVILTFLG